MDIARPDIAAKRVRRRKWLIGTTVAGLVAAGLLIQSLAPATPSIPAESVMIATVKAGRFERRIRAPGTLVPDQQRRLTATSSGEVTQILQRAGDSVETDTVILRLSNPTIEQELSVARLALQVSEAESAALAMSVESRSLEQRARVANSRAAHSSARLQVEAETEAARNGAIPALQLKRSQISAAELQERLEVELALQRQLEQSGRAELRAQHAKSQQAREAFELARSRRDALEVRAGIAGVLQALDVEEGQQVAVGTNLARVARQDVLVAQIRVPEALARDVTTGQPAQIDLRGTSVSGRVRRVHPNVEQGAVSVEIEPDEPLPSTARIDQSVEGIVEIETIAEAVYVSRPIDAQPSTTGAVFRLSDDQATARRVAVRFGQGSVGEITILAGLSAGDRVIVSDLGEWSTRDVIRLR